MLKNALVITAAVVATAGGAAPALASTGSFVPQAENPGYSQVGQPGTNPMGLTIVRARAVLPASTDGVYPGRAALDAKCPAGQVLTGGGAFVRAGDSHTNLVDLDSSYPRTADTWWAHGKNMSKSAGEIEAYAICARKGVHIVP